MSHFFFNLPNMKNFQLRKPMFIKQLLNIVITLTLFSLPQFAKAQTNGNRDSLTFSKLPQFIIRFKDTTNRDTIIRILRSYNAIIKDSLGTNGKVILAELSGPPPAPFNNVIGIAEDAKTKAVVTGCEPNYAGKLPNSLTDTTRFHHSPLPASCRDTSNIRGRCQSEVGRDSTVIAIIDSGLDGVMQGNNLIPSESIFQNRLWNDGTGACGYNFLDNNKMPLDSNGHGTHVAGIIAQTLDFYGAKARFMILKTQDRNGQGTTWDVCRALYYAMSHGAQIVNMSLSYTSVDTSSAPSIFESTISAAGRDAGILVISAAGNNGRNVDTLNLSNLGKPLKYFPAAMKSTNLIKVGSTTCLSNLSTYSNYGKTSVDLAIQGDSIFSSVLNARWNFKNGTSMAAPFVTATAAVLASRRNLYPFNQATIKESMLKTVDNQSYLTTKVVRGGSLNTCNALAYYITHVGAQDVVNQQVAMKVYPNPFETSVNMEFDLNKNQSIEILIYNALGQNILRQKMEGQAGANTWSWQPAGNLMSGMYHVELRTSVGRSIQKIVRF